MIYVVMVKSYKDMEPERYGWFDSDKCPIDKVINGFKYRHAGIRKYPYYYADSGQSIEGIPEIVEVKYGVVSRYVRQFK